MDSSLEWTVAWSFIGEWTSRELAAELSPCQNHMPYDQRSIPLHTWARTCFEQGSLPSLLALPGKAAMLMLPGDKMFPFQYVARVAAAGLYNGGHGEGPPLWACNDWRSVVGTSVKVRALPEPLTCRQEQLLLSQWACTPVRKLHIHHAAHTWLNNKQDLARDCSSECPAPRSR